MPPLSPQAILDDLAGLLRDFDGREYSGAIDRDTLFFGDLGLASIDAVVLGERLERRYGRKIPFHQLLGDLGRRGAEDLALGELADFLHAHLGRPGEEADTCRT
jgi:acyl carrier protein